MGTRAMRWLPAAAMAVSNLRPVPRWGAVTTMLRLVTPELSLCNIALSSYAAFPELTCSCSKRAAYSAQWAVYEAYV